MLAVLRAANGWTPVLLFPTWMPTPPQHVLHYQHQRLVPQRREVGDLACMRTFHESGSGAARSRHARCRWRCHTRRWARVRDRHQSADARGMSASKRKPPQ
jgi:hypothetical protein